MPGEAGATPDSARDQTASEADGTLQDAGTSIRRDYDARRYALLAILALVLLTIAVLGLIFWRRRQRKAADDPSASSIIANVTRTIAEQMPPVFADASVRPRQTVAPAATGSPVSGTPEESADAPPRLDISLDIVSASCSVMTFTIECRIAVTNRSGRAVRDLEVFVGLATAGPKGNPAGDADPKKSHRLETVTRIGPHQAQRISATLQMPLREVRAIRQGERPVFIPIVDVKIKGPHGFARSRDFIVGSPSTLSKARLHPLPLDVPPGGLHNLRAQPIRQFLPGMMTAKTDIPASELSH